MLCALLKAPRKSRPGFLLSYCTVFCQKLGFIGHSTLPISSSAPFDSRLSHPPPPPRCHLARDAPGAPTSRQRLIRPASLRRLVQISYRLSTRAEKVRLLETPPVRRCRQRAPPHPARSPVPSLRLELRRLWPLHNFPIWPKVSTQSRVRRRLPHTPPLQTVAMGSARLLRRRQQL